MQKRFPLAAVLQLREQHETAAERALLSAAADLRRHAEALARLERQLSEHSRHRSALLNRVLTAAEHLSLAAHWNVLQEQLAEGKRLLAEAEARRQEQQARFLQARRDRETLTQLKGEHAEQWAEILDKRDSRAVDDFIAARHVRRN